MITNQENRLKKEKPNQISDALIVTRLVTGAPNVVNQNKVWVFVNDVERLTIPPEVVQRFKKKTYSAK